MVGFHAKTLAQVFVEGVECGFVCSLTRIAASAVRARGIVGRREGRVGKEVGGSDRVEEYATYK